MKKPKLQSSHSSPSSERIVLMDAIYAPYNLPLIAKSCQPEFFTDPARESIFNTILELYDNRAQIDSLVLSQLIPTEYVSELNEIDRTPIPGGAGIGYFINILKNKYACRKLSHHLKKFHEDFEADSSDPYGTANSIIEYLDLIKNVGGIEKRGFEVKDLYDEFKATVVKRVELFRSGKAVALPTGIHQLDKLIGGLYPAQFILIAGRPSLGKSDVALNIAVNISKAGGRSLFMSLEMSRQVVMTRVSCLFSNIYRGKHFSGVLTDFELGVLRDAEEEIKALPLEIIDGSMSTSQIVSYARESHRQKPLTCLVVDYIGLIAPDGKSASREQEVSQISVALKRLAQELNIPVIAISQLNRGVEFRDEKRPKLSDLRDSGSLEQDADIVMLLYRESYYDRASTDDTMEIDVAKNRNGEVMVLSGITYNRGIGRIGDQQGHQPKSSPEPIEENPF